MTNEGECTPILKEAYHKMPSKRAAEYCAQISGRVVDDDDGGLGSSPFSNHFIFTFHLPLCQSRQKSCSKTPNTLTANHLNSLHIRWIVLVYILRQVTRRQCNRQTIITNDGKIFINTTQVNMNTLLGFN